ncbi:unnamed protein product, partial [Sphacelaria rigidula]
EFSCYSGWRKRCTLFRGKCSGDHSDDQASRLRLSPSPNEGVCHSTCTSAVQNSQAETTYSFITPEIQHASLSAIPSKNPLNSPPPDREGRHRPPQRVGNRYRVP